MTSRYVMVCFLFLAFVPGCDQWLVYARQGMIWLLLLVCPTPGGSGVSEWLFSEYYADGANCTRRIACVANIQLLYIFACGACRYPFVAEETQITELLFWQI